VIELVGENGCDCQNNGGKDRLRYEDGRGPGMPGPYGDKNRGSMPFPRSSGAAMTIELGDWFGRCVRMAISRAA
jgi:hypothetical protein